MKNMRHKKVRLLFIVVAFLAFLATSFSQLQTNPLPVEVSCRKSLIGGSYVLQIGNTSSSQLNIWLDAREKFATFLIPAGKSKEIGWVQGYRFDANDVFFIGSDGYDTLRKAMPCAELSTFRIGFSNDGALTINLSQSFLQNQLSKYLRLPIKQNSKILDVEVNEIPQIILRDRSDRIYANVNLQTTSFSGKVHIPIKVAISFVPSFIPSTGVIIASQITVDNININGLPKEWLTEVTTIINQLLPVWFSSIQIYRLDKTTLKYCEFVNVRQVSVHDGRLEIELL
jgi:hypothetical protein